MRDGLPLAQERTYNYTFPMQDLLINIGKALIVTLAYVVILAALDLGLPQQFSFTPLTEKPLWVGLLLIWGHAVFLVTFLHLLSGPKP